MLPGIKIPVPAPDDYFEFKKFTPGSVEDYACVSVCLRLKMSGNRGLSRRVVLGGVCPTTIRSLLAEQVLEGRDISAGLADEAAQAAVEGTDPIDDTRGSAEYKRQMTRIWVKRLILSAAARHSAITRPETGK